MTDQRRTTNMKPTSPVRRSPSGSPPTVHTSLLTQQFAEILRRYKYHRQHIHRLLKETDKSYAEISETRVLTPEKISQIQLTTSDRQSIDVLRSRPLALIVCSQTFNGKARFVNELLNERLLPESPIIHQNDVVRMVRIKVEVRSRSHALGPSCSSSLCIQNHPTHGASLNICGSFELIHPERMYESLSWAIVPRDDLVINGDHPLTAKNESPLDDDGDDDDQQDTASLEIRKPLDLLDDDLQIVLTPSNQKLNIKQIYLQITENVVPIFIYVIDQETLSTSDIEELRYFRRIVPNEPILFIRIEQSNV